MYTDYSFFSLKYVNKLLFKISQLQITTFNKHKKTIKSKRLPQT